MSRDLCPLVGVECLQKDCAWYDVERDRCAMLNLSVKLDDIEEYGVGVLR